MEIAGILRDSVFSPNSNDSRIMEEIARRLRGMGHAVRLYPEARVAEQPLSERAVFSMARGAGALERLSDYEREGGFILNSPRGVRNCMRWNITRLLEESHVLIPPTYYIDLSAVSESVYSADFPCWLKRADGCSEVMDDVCYVENKEDLARALDGFGSRGIRRAVLMRHMEGDIVKFYGVAGTSFFYWYYPTLAGGRSKFGLEKRNGPVRKTPFSAEDLRREMDGFALFSSTIVYGGDCIVSGDGRCWVIDFNDFPSFSPCVEAAAQAVAERISGMNIGI